MVERLVHNTWVYHDETGQRFGRDARNLQHTGMNVRAVFKVNNKVMLNRYMERKRALNKVLCSELKEKPILTEVEDIMKNRRKSEESAFNGEFEEAEVDVEAALPLATPSDWRLDEYFKSQLSENETFLFHGTKEANLKSIVEHGFNYIKYSRVGLYGRGTYLAESSEKSDQYTDYFTTRRQEDLTLIIVRTVLGRVKAHTQESVTVADLKPSPTCDSYVTALNKRFREFLLHDGAQIYPQFIVLYDRG